MTRTDILNAIARTIGARTYCEIGVRNPGDNFDKIQVATKIGVDPVPARGDILRMTSDEYFAKLTEFFDYSDLYFIDGLHTGEQAWNDACNAATFMRPGSVSVVVMHDCLPRSLDAMVPVKPAGGGPWNGTVWQAWCEVRRNPAWESYCIDHDHGCGVFWRGRNTQRAAWTRPTAEQYLADPAKWARVAPLSAVLIAIQGAMGL